MKLSIHVILHLQVNFNIFVMVLFKIYTVESDIWTTGPIVGINAFFKIIIKLELGHILSICKEKSMIFGKLLKF